MKRVSLFLIGSLMAFSQVASANPVTCVAKFTKLHAKGDHTGVRTYKLEGGNVRDDHENFIFRLSRYGYDFKAVVSDETDSIFLSIMGADQSETVSKAPFDSAKKTRAPQVFIEHTAPDGLSVELACAVH